MLVRNQAGVQMWPCVHFSILSPYFSKAKNHFSFCVFVVNIDYAEVLRNRFIFLRLRLPVRILMRGSSSGYYPLKANVK
jgi:hypothetical protein